MRNRHSGKVNAAKQHVLDTGVPFTDSKGTKYFKLDRSMPVLAANGEVAYVINKCEVVRA